MEKNNKNNKKNYPGHSHNFKDNKKVNKKHNPPVKKHHKKKVKGTKELNNNFNNNDTLNINNNKENLKRKKNKTGNNHDIIKIEEQAIIYSDQEMNDLRFDLALKHDQRTYCLYYFSLLKTKHIIIFTFFYKGDYNLRIIKIDLFFIGFILSYVVNALFFNDNTMHQIYEDEGTFNFIYQLPQIVYSTLISSILSMLLEFLALSDDNIIDFKREKNNKNLNERTKNLKKKLNIKYIFYFIISFIFLLFFWYYLSMFGAVYKNTQIHLIKDTSIGFFISLLSPFFFYLLPGLFRIPAISNEKEKRKCLYNISKVIQFF